MKKRSTILKMFCLVLAAALCFSVITVFAEEAEVEEIVTEDIEEVTEAVEEDVTEAIDEEIVEEEIVEDEVLDLFTATLRDNGVYVTPSEDNAAVFTHENLRYKVAAGTGNLIKLDGFESNPTIEEEIAANAKNRLQANGEITTDAAHSGYFGLSVAAGDVVYRTAVTEGSIYVFSAWVKMPSSGKISDDDRAFKVIAESGNEYIVGWNEIGREVNATGEWQQILFTFKAPQTGLFQISFKYKGKNTLSMDDLELYEAEIFDNPLSIKGVVCKDASGAEYTRSTGFTTSGTLTHTTTLYNSDEDDVFFTAVMVLYKNDIMIDFATIEDCALVLDEAEVTFEIEIPEDEDLTQYKYMVYFISDTTPTQYYGEMPSLTNPYIVEGK
ncbi:MAG: carbohydrate binding domain-containing protein [Clostridia bacterium]|nr:carbohydrate binding domain-containing protein [Clostridia bacterium]